MGSQAPVRILAEKSEQINTDRAIAIVWDPPRPVPALPLEPSFLHAVLAAIDRLRCAHPGLVTCRINWESRSCGYQQDFLSAEPVEFAVEEPAVLLKSSRKISNG